MVWKKLADLPVPMSFAHVTVENKDRKVYVTGLSPNDDAPHHVYVYDINTDHWGQLPVSGHYFGIPHIIGGRLSIIGGCLSATNKRTNKVSTFDEASQTWISHYPDMLSVSSKPGVVTHGEYVIVVGGVNVAGIVQDDIETLNWRGNTGWRRVSMTLPVPMYNISCTISGEKLVIVSYYCNSTYLKNYTEVYTISASKITSQEREKSRWNFVPNSNWDKLPKTNHQAVALVPYSSHLVVLGGTDRASATPTADITIFDSSSKSWKKTESSLTSARSTAAVAAISENSIMVIGGCTSRDSMDSAMSSSLSLVELGRLSCFAI